MTLIVSGPDAHGYVVFETTGPPTLVRRHEVYHSLTRMRAAMLYRAVESIPFYGNTVDESDLTTILARWNT